MAPQFISKDNVKEDDVKAARAVFEGEVANIPEAKREIALQGKLDSYLKDKVLLEQPFVKNPDLTVRQMIESAVQKFGEKIEVVRFERLTVK